MIPKIIHYCWFGKGKFPDSVQMCIDSWKKFCPDYEIIEWNEDNFDINYNDFTKEAYEAKKYAFVSDVARLYALVKRGGIYMDTDVEVVKPFDDSILKYEAITGFQTKANQVSTGLLACVKGGVPIFLDFLASYDSRHFKKEDGSYALIPNNCLLTEMCVKRGLKSNNCMQTVDGLTIFPSDYFAPKNNITKTVRITNNTYVIHHYDGSWYSEIKNYQIELKEKYNFLPQKFIKFLSYMKYRGLRGAVRASLRYLDERTKERNNF